MADPATRPDRSRMLEGMLASGADRERGLQRDAESLMDEMIAIHGGVWSVSVDHDDHFILIMRHGE